MELQREARVVMHAIPWVIILWNHKLANYLLMYRNWWRTFSQSWRLINSDKKEMTLMLSSFVPDLINRIGTGDVRQACKMLHRKLGGKTVDRIIRCTRWKLPMMLKLIAKVRTRELLMELGDQIPHHRRRHWTRLNFEDRDIWAREACHTSQAVLQQTITTQWVPNSAPITLSQAPENSKGSSHRPWPSTGSLQALMESLLACLEEMIKINILCAMEQGIWTNVLHLVVLPEKDPKVRIVNNSNSKMHRMPVTLFK